MHKALSSRIVVPSFVLLVGTVLAVGVLHTLVPDHWAPIAMIARARGWSRGRTARAASLAGAGHVLSTLVLGVLAWWVGAVAVARYGSIVDRVAAIALVAFGAWIALASLHEMRTGHGHAHHGHGHPHRHTDGTVHAHWHEHHDEDWHTVEESDVPLHLHGHDVKGRTTLLFLLGSSPMIEGLPAFFAAAPLGVPALVVLAAVFAVATVATYAIASAAALGGMERMQLGAFERYGEVLSGAFVALVGLAAFFL